MTDQTGPLCPEERLQSAMLTAAEDTQRGLEALDRMLTEFADDPRLHFLRGSLLIELRRFIEAHSALAQAVALAPDFHIARFQLGLFELTSGEPDAARSSWAPLQQALPPEHYLARFVVGLDALIADRFADCMAELRAGIAANAENPPLNRDMELIIAKCNEMLGNKQQSAADEAPQDMSATSFLLGTRRH